MNEQANSPRADTSSAEIEDVLLSIRRLVAASHTPAAEAQPADPAPVAETPVADEPPAAAAPEPKLVLTPAQRVSDPDDPWAPVSAPVASALDADEFDDMHEADTAAGSLEAALIATDDGATSADDTAAPDTGAETGDTPDLQDSATRNDRLYNWADVAGMTPEEMLGRMAAKPVTGQDTSPPWPEAPGDDVIAIDPVHPPAQPDPAAPKTNATKAEGSVAPVSLPADGDLSENPAGTEEAPTQPTDAADADAPKPDDSPTPASADRDAPVDATRERAAPETDADLSAEDNIVDDLGADSSPFSFPDAEDAILDEETLREMIVEIVREELQGALGQRITRNVRKMVRREIRIALAMEDME
jgi:hypothetical protein